MALFRPVIAIVDGSFDTAPSSGAVLVHGGVPIRVGTRDLIHRREDLAVPGTPVER